MLEIAHSANCRAQGACRRAQLWQPVPDDGAYKAEDVSDHGRNYDEHNRRHRIEWFDELHRLDHVRPENEIENRLRPADQNKKRPSDMPAADQYGDH